MERVSVSRPLLFAVLSLLLHAAGFAALGHTAKGGNLAVRFDSTSQALVGETLDVDPPSLTPPDEAPEPTSTPTSTSTSTPLGRARGGARAIPSVPPPLYGAVGARFASDLPTTFTRAFPQAASADPVWSSVPFGTAGRAEITLVLDEEGHLGGSDIAGSPSFALRRSIERTLVLLGGRPFTARGAVTRLTIMARVSRDDVHDGLHGDVFALSAGSFAGEIGNAFFALPPAAGPGRRVDVEVRLVP